MDVGDFERLRVRLDRLTRGLRDGVQQVLNRLPAPEQTVQIIQTRMASDSQPHCGAMHLHRYGSGALPAALSVNGLRQANDQRGSATDYKRLVADLHPFEILAPYPTLTSAA